MQKKTMTSNTDKKGLKALTRKIKKARIQISENKSNKKAPQIQRKRSPGRGHPTHDACVPIPRKEKESTGRPAD